MEKEIKLKTQWPSQTTHIVFGIDYVLKNRLVELVDETERRVVVITDNQLKDLYAPVIEHLDLKIFSFPEGETSKTREVKAMLEDDMMAHNFGRDSIVVGLGGGVVSDVAGYLASTYCRGVPYIQIPTSLLAMVDASIGGKNGVNTPYGKNMVGTFYPPSEVLVDGAFLKTLSDRQMANGVVEMIKAGLIDSPALFGAMQDNVDRWEEKDLPFMMEQIYESLKIKKEAVEKDPEEQKGSRRVLNLGHTFGHALEQLEEYEIEHGEAVAIGILVSGYISNKMGMLSSSELETIRMVLLSYGVPLKLPRRHGLDEIMALLARDKKALKSTPRIVLLESIGQVASFGGEYCTPIEFPMIEEAVNWMYKEFCDG